MLILTICALTLSVAAARHVRQARCPNTVAYHLRLAAQVGAWKIRRALRSIRREAARLARAALLYAIYTGVSVLLACAVLCGALALAGLTVLLLWSLPIILPCVLAYLTYRHVWPHVWRARLTVLAWCAATLCAAVPLALCGLSLGGRLSPAYPIGLMCCVASLAFALGRRREYRGPAPDPRCRADVRAEYDALCAARDAISDEPDTDVMCIDDGAIRPVYLPYDGANMAQRMADCKRWEVEHAARIGSQTGPAMSTTVVDYVTPEYPTVDVYRVDCGPCEYPTVSTWLVPCEDWAARYRASLWAMSDRALEREGTAEARAESARRANMMGAAQDEQQIHRSMRRRSRIARRALAKLAS